MTTTTRTVDPADVLTAASDGPITGHVTGHHLRAVTGYACSCGETFLEGDVVLMAVGGNDPHPLAPHVHVRDLDNARSAASEHVHAVIAAAVGG